MPVSSYQDLYPGPPSFYPVDSAPVMTVQAQFPPGNFLTGQNAGFEGGIGTWVTGGNSVVALDSAHQRTGVNSMSVASSIAGAMAAQHCLSANILTQGMPVIPGQQIQASAWFRSASAQRSCQVGVGFFDATGVNLSGPAGPSVTDGVSGWVQATGLFTAPASAARAQAYVLVSTPSGGAEFHYVDDVLLSIFTPVWTDISKYVMNLQVTRPVTRLQGPLWQYQAGTCSLLLDNSDGRFDPDNLAGPYTSTTALQQVIWTLGPGQTKTWTAPRNLSGATVQVEAWGGASAGTGGAGGGGGEYARENTYAVIPGQPYVAFTPSGNSGGSSTFDSTGVVAHSAAANGSAGGTGSANSVHFDGGAGGAAGTSAVTEVGGGGGSSAGPASAGTAGAAGNSGGAGGLAPAGGYSGGNGAPDGRYPGGNGAGPGGAGGGSGSTTSGTHTKNSANGHSRGGQIRLTYFVTLTSATIVTQVLPMVPIQVNATWNFVTYPLFTGFADSWTETAVDYSAGYSEVTLAATDGFKLLTANTIPVTSPVGAGEDSGARADRILDFAGWPSGARLIDFGDTTQQAATFGSDALSLLQLTADTEIGEAYVNGAGNVVFRHRHAILSDTRSTIPQAVFGDQPGVLAPQVSWHGDGVHGGTGAFIGITAGPYINYIPPNVQASKQLWVWSSVPYAAGVQAVLNFFDATLAFISTASGPVIPVGPVPVLVSVTATSPPTTLFGGVQVQVQGIPASSVIFFAEAAPPLDAGDLHLYPVLAPWTPISGTTTLTTLANWSPISGVPGEIPYAAVGRANDDTTLANDVQITAAGSSNLQEATDPVSVYQYQSERSYVRADLLLPDDATALQFANWVLFISRNSEDRFDTLTIDPLADTQNLYPQVLGREIGDRIQVWRTPASVAARVVKDVFIRGIAHSFDAGTGVWQTQWTLQSAVRYGGFMTLDSATNGLLDQRALAY